MARNPFWHFLLPHPQYLFLKLCSFFLLTILKSHHLPLSFMSSPPFLSFGLLQCIPKLAVSLPVNPLSIKQFEWFFFNCKADHVLDDMKKPVMAFFIKSKFLNTACKALVPLSLSLTSSCATLSFPYFSIFVLHVSQALSPNSRPFYQQFSIWKAPWANISLPKLLC